MGLPPIPNQTSVATYTGRYVDFVNPTPDMIDLEDIAQGLSNITRFAGQLGKFYSVAQHSCLVASAVAGVLGSEPEIPKDELREMVLKAILHDATEAYMSDIPRPFKRMFPEISVVEGRLLDTIFERFGLSPGLPDIIHDIDGQASIFEMEHLSPHGLPEDWGGKWDLTEDVVDPFGFLENETYVSASPELSRDTFIILFDLWY